MKRKPDGYLKRYKESDEDATICFSFQQNCPDALRKETLEKKEVGVCFCKPELLDWVEKVRTYIQNNVDDGCHGVEIDLLYELNSLLPEVKSNE